MIPREILKKIRQIELRTNRIVIASVDGGCMRTPQFSNAPTNHPALRRGRRPQPRSAGEIQPVFWFALTCVLSPRRGFHPVTFSVESAARPNHPTAGYSKDAGSVSPSPWGEGRDEGGRKTNLPESKSLQSLDERIGIPAGMPDGEHTNFIAFDPEINSVFESGHPRLANESGFFLKKFGVLFDAFKQRQKFGVEFLSQARLPLFIPFQSLKIVKVGGRFEPQPLHFQPKRLRASSRTCSNGIPSRGFLLNSSARRSSSAFCSGVIVSSKSPNSRSMVSTSSRRSISGIRRSSSRISVALMESNLTAVKLFASA
jgi:hypothetical protein